jgi:hypothetical protein
LELGLQGACPPDLGEVPNRVRQAWVKILEEEAGADAEVLLDTLEPYQKEVEHYFALQRQGHFRGLMAGYLHLIHKLKYAGSTLRENLPFAGQWLGKRDSDSSKEVSLELGAFTRMCSQAASERYLDARGRALANRLLVKADDMGFPLSLLSDSTEKAACIDWRQRYAQALGEELGEVEHEWTKPKGTRRWVQNTILFLADWLPLLALLGGAAMPLWRYFMDPEYQPQLVHFLLPLGVLLLVLIILHVLIVIFLPLRWQAIRSQFERMLEKRLRKELEKVYASVPGDVVDRLALERRQIENIQKEVMEVTRWLEQREEAASITGLYGK